MSSSSDWRRKVSGRWVSGFSFSMDMADRITRLGFLTFMKKQGKRRSVLPLATEIRVFDFEEEDDEDGEVRGIRVKEEEDETMARAAGDITLRRLGPEENTPKH